MYKTRSKRWFLNRIGKRIFRDSTNCCASCERIAKEGLIVRDEAHADYLSCMDAEFANCGVFMNYRDKLYETKDIYS